MLRRFHAIIWKRRRDIDDIVAMYKRNCTKSVDQLSTLEGIDITTRCELGLMKDLFNDNTYKGKGKTDPHDLIHLIRSDITFAPYVIEQRKSIQEQVDACTSLIQMLKHPKDDHENRLVEITTQYFKDVRKGTVKQLELMKQHCQRGCLQLIEDDLPTAAFTKRTDGLNYLKSTKWSPNENSSVIENRNKAFGAGTKGKGQMREAAIDRRLLCTALDQNNKLAKKLGQPSTKNSYAILTDSVVYSLVTSVFPPGTFPGSADWMINDAPTDAPQLTEPLEPMGTEYLAALKSNQYYYLTAEAQKRYKQWQSNSSSLRSSTSSSSSPPPSISPPISSSTSSTSSTSTSSTSSTSSLSSSTSHTDGSNTNGMATSSSSRLMPMPLQYNVQNNGAAVHTGRSSSVKPDYSFVSSSSSSSSLASSSLASSSSSSSTFGRGKTSSNAIKSTTPGRLNGIHRQRTTYPYTSWNEEEKDTARIGLQLAASMGGKDDQAMIMVAVKYWIEKSFKNDNLMDSERFPTWQEMQAFSINLHAKKRKMSVDAAEGLSLQTAAKKTKKTKKARPSNIYHGNPHGKAALLLTFPLTVEMIDAKQSGKKYFAIPDLKLKAYKVVLGVEAKNNVLREEMRKHICDIQNGGTKPKKWNRKSTVVGSQVKW